MIATRTKVPDREPGDIEMLLPWHAAGTLNTRDARRVDEAIARDPDLATQYLVIRDEYAETIHLNESLGAPSVRAMQKLFAAIDAEPERKASTSVALSVRIAEFFGKLSPRTLAWSASLGAVALLLQAGVIAAVLMKTPTGSFETASLNTSERAAAPLTRDLAGSLPRALVRFAPEARIADITALLESYQASIVDGAKGGMFRLQFGNAPTGRNEVAALLGRLQKEKIVSLAVEAQ